MWVDPSDPKHLIFGPADGVDSNGRIERTTDGGHTWEDASEGLNAPWFRHMVERMTQVGDELLAVLSNGDLIVASLEALRWRRVLAMLEGVAAVAVLEA